MIGDNTADVTAHRTRGRSLAAAGRLDEALPELCNAVAADPGDVEAHLAIYEVAQLLRQPELALEHQRRAIALARVHSTFASEREEYALLVPSVPGPYTANTPLDLLFDPARVTLHRWYVDPLAGAAPLPRFDAVFTAIGESQAAQPALAALTSMLARLNVPVFNRPEAIARLGRLEVMRTFANARRCRVPQTTRISRERYIADGFPTPHVVRPVDSHGGHAFVRVDNDQARAEYVRTVDASDLYVQPFIDYRSGDGLFRKYRIIFVDGMPFPFHLAISPNWMVHYYNAPMAEHAWMRDEERAFLANMRDVFRGELADALAEAAAFLPLDYVGIDCAIDRDGTLLIFEADNAVIVHLLDDPALFGYKREYVPRITAALDELVRRRIAQSAKRA